MARLPTVSNIADLKGARKKNPQRFRDTVEPDKPLGEPPEHLDDDVKAVWYEVCKLAIKGTIAGSDRIALELLANLIWQFRESPFAFPASKYNRLVSLLAHFGMTPSARRSLGGDKSTKVDDDFEDL